MCGLLLSVQRAAGGSGGGDANSGPGSDAPDLELGEPDGEGEKSCVIFRMAHGVAFGEQLKVVGDGPVLGAWDITQAPSKGMLRTFPHTVSSVRMAGQYGRRRPSARAGGWTS